MSNRIASPVGRKWEYVACTPSGITVWFDKDSGDCLIRQGHDFIGVWCGQEGAELAGACWVMMDREGPKGLARWLRTALSEPAEGLLHGMHMPPSSVQ